MILGPPKNGELQHGKVWFERKGSVLTLGVTDSAIRSLGEIEELELPAEGEEYEMGDVVTTLEGSQGRLEVKAPATGSVHEVNGAAKDDAQIVSEDPLEGGWLVQLAIDDVSELDSSANEEDDDDAEEDDEDGS